MLATAMCMLVMKSLSSCKACHGRSGNRQARCAESFYTSITADALCDEIDSGHVFSARPLILRGMSVSTSCPVEAVASVRDAGPRLDMTET